MASRPHGLPGGSPPDRMRCGDYKGSAPRQRETEERHDSLGARRALGGVGGISGPPTVSATAETEERHDSLGARRALGGVGGHFGAPHGQRDSRNRGAPRFTGGATRVGGCGGPFRGPPRSARQPKPRSATIHSGRDARWGVWGAISGPPTFSATTETEERHDSLGARRALGGVGGHFEAPPRSARQPKPRSATIHS